MPVASTLDLLKEILQADCPDYSKNYSFLGLEFDSREIKGGELFVALSGDNTHGNQYVATALERGAALVVAEKGASFENLEDKDRILFVDNSLSAFWKIAAWWRDQINLPTFAVTGSVGKTTVKEMTAAILLQKGVGTYSLKSHNNHVGVPYTICRASKDHNWLILEIGMNHSGEIGPLSELAKPDLAAVVNVAPAHIGYLGSLENIADEKLQIANGLKENGTLLLNADSKELLARSVKQVKANKISLRFFGLKSNESGKISNIKANGLAGITFDLCLDDQTQNIKMKVLGRQNASNAACAALAAKLLLPKISFDEISQGLARFTAPLMRLNVKYLSNGAVVVDDSYNANPASMAAAIQLAADLPKAHQRVGLVIGDMLELGDFSSKYHKEISDLVKQIKPQFIIAVGEHAKDYLSKLDGSDILSKHCLNAEQASSYLKDLEFDFLVVKASRGVGLDKVVNELIQRIGELPYEPELNEEE